MDKLREHVSGDTHRPATGMVSNLKRVSSDAALSTTELRDFVRSLKGRSPQEVLGAITSNALTQAMIQATVATVVLLAVLTIGPYAISGPAKPKAKPTGTAAAQSQAEPAKTAAAASESSETPSGDNLKKASKAMGLDETKTADPNKNPLDTFDNLLDKVK